ncbi:MAG: hypothetical protein ACM3PZ_03475 [Bacillota bacterium]
MEIAAFILAVLALLPAGDMLKSFSSLPQREKRTYRALTFLVIGSIFGLMYALQSDDVYFDPNTGKPMKYYSVSPEGTFTFFSSPGYDPLTGNKLMPVTQDIILRSRGVVPEANRYQNHYESSENYQQSSQSTYDPPPDPVPEEEAQPDPPEQQESTEARNTSGNSWGLVDSKETATVTFMNWNKEPITVYNLANEEKCVLPGVSTRFHKLSSGRYRYFQNGEMLGSFEVVEGIDREVVIGQPQKEPERVETDRSREVSKPLGTLICENKTSGLVRVCDRSGVVVLIVPSRIKREVKLSPGRYTVYMGHQRGFIEIKANSTQNMECVDKISRYRR